MTLMWFVLNDHVPYVSEMHKQLVQKVHEDFSIVLTHNFKVDPQLVPELSAKIKQFYFGDKEVGMDTAYELVDVSSVADIPNSTNLCF